MTRENIEPIRRSRMADNAPPRDRKRSPRAKRATVARKQARAMKHARSGRA